jgi:hypothetical protein
VGHRVGLDEVEKRRNQILMAGTEIVLETSMIFNQLTQLITREDFIKRKVSCSCKELNSDSWVAHSVG